MNINQLIIELQEKNREYALKEYGYHTEELDQLTTDTAHAVAKAVIGEIKTWTQHPYDGVCCTPKYINKKIATLEAKIKDV